MRKLSVCAASLVALLAFGACCADASPKAIGFFFENPADAGKDKDSPAHVLRDGVSYSVDAGDPVFPGDTVITNADGDISIAFLDSSAIRVLASTKLQLTSLGDPAVQEDSHIALLEGHASMDVASHSRFVMDVGDQKNALVADSRVAPRESTEKVSALTPRASSTVKFNIEVNIVNGAYVTTVAVTSGTVTLTPVAGGKTDIVVGTVVVATLNMTAILKEPRLTKPR